VERVGGACDWGVECWWIGSGWVGLGGWESLDDGK
jgi:hypothetical protein